MPTIEEIRHAFEGFKIIIGDLQEKESFFVEILKNEDGKFGLLK